MISLEVKLNWVFASSGSHWIIYLGSVDLTASESGRQIAQSVDSILHEDYSKANLANDVALLVLRVPVDIDSE